MKKKKKESATTKTRKNEAVSPNAIERDIQKKIQIIKEILDNINQIFNIFKPIIKKMKTMEETQKYRTNGTLKKASSLFGDIANQCKDLANLPLVPEGFLENLGN